MKTVQLALTNGAYAKALRRALMRIGTWRLQSVDVPDLERKGIIIVDGKALDRLPRPLPNAERVVLIARNDPQTLSRAWDAGIRSVVFENEPPVTAALAVMAAALRNCRVSRPNGSFPPPVPKLVRNFPQPATSNTPESLGVREKQQA